MTKALRILGITFLVFASVRAFAEPNGRMKVKVLGPGAIPVANAVVWAIPADGRPMGAAIPECLSNSAGVCTIQNLPSGIYQVTAMKESDGYPNTAYDFYSHTKKPALVRILANGKPLVLTISVGPKAGIITFDLVNSVTQKRVNGPATVTLRLADAPSIFISLSAEGKILIPSDQDVLVVLSVNGFRRWERNQPIRVRPGESVKLQAELQPE